jgi:hypothetical protein
MLQKQNHGISKSKINAIPMQGKYGGGNEIMNNEHTVQAVSIYTKYLVILMKM